VISGSGVVERTARGSVDWFAAKDVDAKQRQATASRRVVVCMSFVGEGREQDSKGHPTAQRRPHSDEWITDLKLTVHSWAIELLPGYCQHTNNVTVRG
jgi:hypothetical protein